MSSKAESAAGEMAPPPYQNPQDHRYPPPPNQQHYPGPNQPYYPPPQQQPYYPPMPPMQQMQSSNNVTIVNNTAGATHTVVVKQGVNHCLHCCITIFFFPWIIVWIILCCIYGC